MDDTDYYEITIIMKPDASTEDIEEMQRTVEPFGTVWHFEDEGIKRLAYRIDGHERGRFLFWQVEPKVGNYMRSCTVETMNEVLRKKQKEEKVLRYLVIKERARRRQ